MLLLSYQMQIMNMPVLEHSLLQLLCDTTQLSLLDHVGYGIKFKIPMSLLLVFWKDPQSRGKLELIFFCRIYVFSNLLKAVESSSFILLVKNGVMAKHFSTYLLVQCSQIWVSGEKLNCDPWKSWLTIDSWQKSCVYSLSPKN